MINFLVQLTEKDKRVIAIIVTIVILAILVFYFLGSLVKRIMVFQAKKAEDMVANVVNSGVINNEKDLRKFGNKKNARLFFKQASPAFIIMLVASLIIVLYCIINNNWKVNIFDYKEEGFLTLFRIRDPNLREPKQIDIKLFNISLLVNAKVVISEPHFSWKAWGSYLFVPTFLVGLIWYLVTVQAYIARAFKIWKISKEAFAKKLDSKFTKPANNSSTLTPPGNTPVK